MGRERQRKVLVIRNSALGDVAMTLPVVYSVARSNPDVVFCVLTRPFFSGMFINPPANVSFIKADFKGRYKGFAGMVRLLRDLRREHFTDVADLHNVLRSWIIDAAARLGGRRVAMVDKARRKRSRANKSHTAQESFIDRYKDVFRRLGLESRTNFETIFPDGTPATAVAVNHPAVGIAPFARYSTKTYPVEIMEEVVSRLAADGINVYLFGARGSEAELFEKWQEKHPSVTSVAGKYPLPDELALMASMDVMLAMDSANQHLAALTRVPVVTVWGGTSPACGFRAYGQLPGNDICLGLDCQPCSTAGTRECPLGTLACLRGIKPDTIISKIKENL